MSSSSVYRLADGVNFETVDDGAVILVFRSGQLFSCNETSTAFLTRLDGKRNLTDIAVLMAEEFEAPADAIAADLEILASEMVSEGIIVPAT